MRKIDAIKMAVDDGVKIRLMGWDEGRYILYSRLYWYDENGRLHDMHSNYMCEEGWEIYKQSTIKGKDKLRELLKAKTDLRFTKEMLVEVDDE